MIKKTTSKESINPNLQFLRDKVPQQRVTLLQGGTRCLEGSTLVLTETGYKPIKDIEIGENVYSMDGDNCVLKPVVNKFMYKGGHASSKTLTFMLYNQTIRCTYEHKFRINGEWVKAIDIAKSKLEKYKRKVRNLGSGDTSYFWEVLERSRLPETLNNETCCGQERLSKDSSKREDSKDSQVSSGTLSTKSREQTTGKSQEWDKVRQHSTESGMVYSQGEHRPRCSEQANLCKQWGEEWDVKTNTGSCNGHKKELCTLCSNGKGTCNKTQCKSICCERCVNWQDMETSDISQIIIHEDFIDVYDIEVFGTHNYLVTTDNIVSHNSGKTYSTIIYLIYMCMSHTGMEIDITRDTFKALKATAWKDFQDVLQSMGLYTSDNHNKSDGIYTLNGNTINYFGSDHEGKVHGKSRDILWINEAQLMSEPVLDQLLPRTRHRVIMDYNPALGDNHWLDPYIESYPPLITTYRDNPHLTASQIEDIKSRRNNKYWWSIYGMGKRSRVEGAIFTNWEEGEFDDSLSFWFGQDYGFSNDPTTLVKVAIDESKKIIYVHELLYETHLSASQIGELNVKHAEGNLIIGDSAEPRLIQELRTSHRLNVQGAKKVTINEGIVMMNNYKIIVTASSKNLKSELSKYRWQDKGKTVPIDNHNHLIDAIRYACMWRISRPNYGKYVIG